jgi:hypothetical protein
LRPRAASASASCLAELCRGKWALWAPASSLSFGRSSRNVAPWPCRTFEKFSRTPIAAHGMGTKQCNMSPPLYYVSPCEVLGEAVAPHGHCAMKPGVHNRTSGAHSKRHSLVQHSNAQLLAHTCAFTHCSWGLCNADIDAHMRYAAMARCGSSNQRTLLPS